MIRNILYILSLGFIIFQACTKDPVNPYDSVKPPPDDSTSLYMPDPKSFEGLHAYIFKPTCANSGCHDGTFEPDFRNILSAYNTLVYRPIIKNDPFNTYQYRVLPGNPDKSVIFCRLTKDIDGQSGLMPLSVDPGSDWNTKKDEYISNIKEWISNGAKDIFGNTPTLNNIAPQIQGVLGKTSEYLDRNDSGQGAIRVLETETSMDIYFAFSDDKTPVQQFTNTKIKFSKSPNDFAGATDLPLQLLGTPLHYKGYYGSDVDYYYKVTIDPKDYGVLKDYIYFRVYVTDGSGVETEIPTKEGAYYIKNYFSFNIVM